MKKKLEELAPFMEDESDEAVEIGDEVLIDLEKILSTHPTIRVRLPKDAIIEDHGHEIVVHRSDEEMGS